MAVGATVTAGTVILIGLPRWPGSDHTVCRRVYIEFSGVTRHSSRPGGKGGAVLLTQVLYEFVHDSADVHVAPDADPLLRLQVRH